EQEAFGVVWRLGGNREVDQGDAFARAAGSGAGHRDRRTGGARPNSPAAEQSTAPFDPYTYAYPPTAGSSSPPPPPTPPTPPPTTDARPAVSRQRWLELAQ